MSFAPYGDLQKKIVWGNLKMSVLKSLSLLLLFLFSVISSLPSPPQFFAYGDCMYMLSFVLVDFCFFQNWDHAIHNICILLHLMNILPFLQVIYKI